MERKNLDRNLVIEIYNSKNQLFKVYDIDENNVQSIYMTLEGNNLVDGMWVAKLFDSGTLLDETTFSVEGTEILKPKTTTVVCDTGTMEKGVCIPTDQEGTSQSQGGCLIATATFGTELAPQVQLLREIRDHTLLQTNSGSSFMSGFNAVYYSFSPTIADWERQNPVFKEIVKMTMAPVLSTLSILNYANIDSEQEMLGYGIGIILLNLGTYFVVPAIVILKIRANFLNHNH